MMHSDNPNSLTSLLESLDKHAHQDPVELGELVKAFRARGFGPLLMVPALFVMLPTGTIPGVPAVCGLLIAFISIQIVMGREHPWLPRKLKIFSVSRNRLSSAIGKSRDITRRIDSYLDHRLEILTTRTCQRIVGSVIFVLSLFMIFIGFIPFIPALLALPIFFFALGYAARDGLLVAFGIILVTMAAAWATLALAGLQ